MTATPPEDTAGGAHVAEITPNRWIPSPLVRKWLYGVAVAVGLLLAGYGILTGDQVALWLQVIGAVLAIGTPALALANTPRAH